MKKFAKLLAVVLAVAMLAGCSLVAKNPEKTVVATVDGVDIMLAQLNESLNYLLSAYGYTAESAEIADQLETLKLSTLDMMIEDTIISNKIEEYGFNIISEADEEAAKANIDAWYAENLATLTAGYASDPSVADAEAQAKQTIEEYLATYQTTLEDMKADEIASIPYDRLYEEVTKDVVVTEEEAKITYAEYVANDKATFEEDMTKYSTSINDGVTVYYKPEGYFYVKHILIGLTDEQQTEIANLRYDDDEAVAATADDKRAEMLAGIQEEADAALAAVNAGGDFDALIAEYGDDPGMRSEMYTDGYLTYIGNINFVAEFTAACDKLTEDGMTTGLVASDFGYHIIRRVGTMEAGEIPFEEVKEATMADLLDVAKSDAYEAAVAAWIEAANVTINDKNL